VKPAVVAVVTDGCVLAPNKLPEPAAEPNAGVAAEPKILPVPDAVHEGVPNVCEAGVPNENPLMPVPPPVADVVLGVPNWNPPDMVKFLLQQSPTTLKIFNNKKDVATRCMVSKTWIEKYRMSFSNGLGEMGLGEMGRHH